MSALPNLTAEERSVNGSLSRGYVGAAFPHIGTWNGARAALYGDLPFLGRGHFRTAYLGGSWVYKVVEGGTCHGGCHYQQGIDWQLSEYANLTYWGRAGLNTVAAPTALWLVEGNGIIAQPFYPLDVMSTARLIEAYERFTRNLRMHNPFGIFDAHPGNFRGTVHERLRLIDASEWF